MPEHVKTTFADVAVAEDLPHPSIDGAVLRGLRIGGRGVSFVDEDGGPGVVDLDVIGPARLADISRGLREIAGSRPRSQIWQVDPAPDEDPVTLFFHAPTGDVRAVIHLPVDPVDDPGFASRVSGVIAPVLANHQVRLLVDDDPLDQRTVELVINEPDGRVSELTACAVEARALVRALGGGGLTFEGARDLVLGGHARALVGSQECEWLDAKGAPYGEDARGQYELAKDVAAFANAGGGLILMPATTRTVDGVEAIEAVKEIDAKMVNRQSWEDRVADRVYPPPAGVRVCFIGSDRGQVLIIVPAQAEQRKPFLVRGAVEGERHVRHAITLPWRDGDRTRFDDIAVVHGALRAQRRADQTANGRFRAALKTMLDDLDRMREVLDIDSGRSFLGTPRSPLEADPTLVAWLASDAWTREAPILAEGLLEHPDVWDQLRWTMTSVKNLQLMHHDDVGHGTDAIIRKGNIHDDASCRVTATINLLRPFAEGPLPFG